MKISYKFLSIILISIIIYSCNESKIIKRKEIKLEVFLNGFFESNPNWNQNDIIHKEINEKFKIEIQNQIENGILEDFPLELGEINEYEKGKYAAIFISHYIKSDSLD
ncbi:hypothetical protein, partial [Aquirufa beregesia]